MDERELAETQVPVETPKDENPTLTFNDQETGNRSSTKDDSSELALSDRLASARMGDYELIEEIARGGMGVVYKARQTKLGRIVAIKTIKSGGAADEEMVRRFQAEVQAAASLDHPYIVPIYEVGQWLPPATTPNEKTDPVHFFSMGYVEGHSLANELKNGPLPSRDAAELVKQLCEAMQYAHDHGIVHRDLKPGNILLSITGDSIDGESNRQVPNASTSAIAAAGKYLPKIADFGLAKNIAEDSGMTASGAILGTPSYMPPEQAGARIDDVGPKSDVYSLGAILYASVTGRPPFQAANVMETLKQVLECDPIAPTKLVPSLDKDVETICLKCLEKNPEERYESARSMADDLERYLKGEPIHARPCSRIGRVWKWCRRNRSLASVGAVAAVLMLTLAIGGPLVALNQTRINSDLTLANFKLDTALKDVTAQKERADGNLVRADEVVQQFVMQIADQNGPLTQHPGTQRLRSDLLDKGRVYYEKLIEENKESGLTPRLAKANHELAKILADLSGNSAKAIDVYLETVRLFKGLSEKEPKEANHFRRLAGAYEGLGLMYTHTGDLDKAMSTYTRSLQEYQRMEKENLLEDEDRDDHASVLNNIGWLKSDRGELDEALKTHLEALAIREQLFKDNPLDPEFMEELANGLGILGDLYVQLNRYSDAKSVYDRAHSMVIKLEKEYPGNLKYVELVASSHSALSAYEKAIGNFPKAIEEIRLSRKRQKNLATNNPAVWRYRDRLAKNLIQLFELLLMTGKMNDASEAIEEAVTVSEKLADENPEIAEIQSTSAFAQMHYASYLRSADLLPAAIKAYSEAIRICETLSAKFPTEVLYQNRLAICYMNTGIVYQAMGDTESAIDAQRKSLAIKERLIQLRPQMLKYRMDLAGNLVNLANVERSTDPENSLLLLDRAVKLLKVYLQQQSENAQARQFFSSALAVRAMTLGDLKRHTEAVADLRLGLEYANARGEADIQRRLARALARCGKYFEATTLADSLMVSTRSASHAYMLAGCYAQAARAAGEDTSLSEIERDQMVESYAKKAILLLNDLEGSDHFNTEDRRKSLREADDDLNSLRNRDDFEDVLENVAERHGK